MIKTAKKPKISDTNNLLSNVKSKKTLKYKRAKK
jgi:hypothetical protein